jgi:hypothetical protein
MAMFQIIGINSSYGVFQQYYASKESFLPPETSTSAIAFIGTMGKHNDASKNDVEGYGLSWGLGVFISPLMAKVKDVRVIPAVGAVLMSLGLILASFSTSVLSSLLYF